jgi:mannitol/fructose-specific phosphotransferase system IIA component (Ntr-type)
LINNSPHPYDGVSFTVLRHNAVRNWRAIQFNKEC